MTDIKSRIEKLTTSGVVDSARYREVLNSFSSFLERTGSLTAGQERYLSSIEEKYSDEAIQRKRDWSDNYSESHKRDAFIMARYYSANPPYFGDLAASVLADPEYVLTEAQFNKMCRNKYAKRVLEESTATPKYSVGSMVQIRTTTARTYDLNGASYRLVPNSYAAVLESDAKPVRRAAKGSKVYKILPVGSNPVFVYESDIKRARKIKK